MNGATRLAAARASRLAICLALPLVCACRPNMVEQPRIDPYEPTAVFDDRMSARLPVEGTVARGERWMDTPITTGMRGSEPIAEVPVPVTMQLLERGRVQYDVYCAPCHSRTGDGDGMVVRRGFRQPPSFFEARLLEARAGHFFEVMTNGIGAMPPYAYLVPIEDRWAIVAYIRALQLSVTAAGGAIAAAAAARPGGGE